MEKEHHNLVSWETEMRDNTWRQDGEFLQSDVKWWKSCAVVCRRHSGISAYSLDSYLLLSPACLCLFVPCRKVELMCNSLSRWSRRYKVPIFTHCNWLWYFFFYQKQEYEWHFFRGPCRYKWLFFGKLILTNHCGMLFFFALTGAMSGGFNFQANDGVNFTPRQIFSITAKALVLRLENNRPLKVFPGNPK